MQKRESPDFYLQWLASLLLWVCTTCKTTYSLQSHTHILNEGWGGAWRGLGQFVCIWVVVCWRGGVKNFQTE